MSLTRYAPIASNRSSHTTTPPSHSRACPIIEMLYIPTSVETKFKAKVWIDVVGARIAKGLGSVINANYGGQYVKYGRDPKFFKNIGTGKNIGGAMALIGAAILLWVR